MPSLWDIARCCCAAPDSSCNGCSACCCSGSGFSIVKIVFDFPGVALNQRQARLDKTQPGPGECARYQWNILAGFPYQLGTSTTCFDRIPAFAVNGLYDIRMACKLTGTSLCGDIPGCSSSCHNYELRVVWCDPVTGQVNAVTSNVPCQCSPLLLTFTVPTPPVAGGAFACGCNGWGASINATVTLA